MKQKLTALLLVLCMVMAFVPAMALASAAEDTGSTEVNGGSSDEWNVWDGTVAEAFSDDSAGTESDPILIKSAAEFIYLRSVLTSDDTAGKYYQLAVNLDMNGKDVSLPYTVDSKKGNIATAITGFAGVFDGAGNTIKNISDTVSGKTGLFYIVTSTGVVKNLTVTDSKFDVGWTNMTGTICYQLAGGVIENCHVKDTSLAGGRVGGIASDVTSGGTIRECSVNANFVIKTGGGTAAEVGGIAGSLTKATITDCVVDGLFKDGNNSNGVAGRFGGIVGLVQHNAASVIKNCVNNASITLTYSNATKTQGAGGIVGYVGDWGKSMLTVSNCTNNGAVTVGYSAPVGGIIGGIRNPNAVAFENCYNTAPIYAVGNDNNGVGGIIGVVSSATNASTGQGAVPFVRCKNSGTITATGDNVGGLIGNCNGRIGNYTFTECLSAGEVSGGNNVGGGIGYSATTVNNTLSFVSSNLCANVKATGQYAGLVFGCYKVDNDETSLTVQNSLLQGQVTAAGKAGTIVGAVGTNGTVAAPIITLKNAYVQATVTVDAGAVAGTIAGGATEEAITGVTLTVNGSKFAIQVVVGGSAVEAPNAYYNYAGEGTAVALDALDVADLTNGTAVGVLNNGLETVAWIQGTKTPELIVFYVAPVFPEITIDGASLTIGENVTLNLFVKTETIRNAGVTVKTISIVNNDGETVANGELKDTNYVFTIEGLSAKEFGTNKIYKVQYTTEDAPETPVTCTETIEYSPLQYAINMYGKTDKAGLDALLLSIVNYADAAAKNTNASTAFKEKHADADMTRVTAMETIVAKDTGKYTYDAKTMPGISATLTNAIELKVVPNETYTDVTVKVGDEIIEKNGNGAYAFYATDLYNEITFTFTGAEGTEPLTATTSLVQFLNAYAGTDYEAQATATAQYLYAARNFCLKNRTNA